MRRTPALIIGGGPAGAAAAIVLASAGHRPELVERTRGPDTKVCGGFLSWDTLAALGRLGVDVSALGARPIGRLRIVSGHKVIEADLPASSAGLSRARLDEAALDAAARVGAAIRRGCTVRSIAGQQVRLDDGETVEADALFLATGKHELRGAPRLPADERRGLAAGLRASLPSRPDLQQGLAGVIELHLFDGGYAGLLLQEDGSANICLSVARGRLADGIEALLEGLEREAPLLADRLGGARPEWDAIASIPYGWRARTGEAGRFRIGDQGAVIASLAGDGIAIALASGEAAARSFLRRGGAGAPAFQAELARRAALPLRLAGLMRRVAEQPLLRDAMWPLLATFPSMLAAGAKATRIGL